MGTEPETTILLDNQTESASAEIIDKFNSKVPVNLTCSAKGKDDVTLAFMIKNVNIKELPSNERIKFLFKYFQILLRGDVTVMLQIFVFVLLLRRGNLIK